MPERYYLTQNGLNKIRDIISKVERELRNRKLERSQVDTPNTTRNILLAKTPDGGIPSLTIAEGTGTGTTDYDRPGEATCDIYRTIRPSTGYSRVHRIGAGFDRLVYNYNNFAIPGNKYIEIVQDRYGDWYAPILPLETTECDISDTGTSSSPGEEAACCPGTGTGQLATTLCGTVTSSFCNSSALWEWDANYVGIDGSLGAWVNQDTGNYGDVFLAIQCYLDVYWLRVANEGWYTFDSVNCELGILFISHTFQTNQLCGAQNSSYELTVISDTTNCTGTDDTGTSSFTGTGTDARCCGTHYDELKTSGICLTITDLDTGTALPAGCEGPYQLVYNAAEDAWITEETGTGSFLGDFVHLKCYDDIQTNLWGMRQSGSNVTWTAYRVPSSCDPFLLVIDASYVFGGNCANPGGIGQQVRFTFTEGTCDTGTGDEVEEPTGSGTSLPPP